ncbi:MAG: DNA gyrase subunit A [bacterium]|nr:DNA gyrase subunit A [bacterium]
MAKDKNSGRPKEPAKGKTKQLNLLDSRIISVDIEDEMKNSYIDYAMSVIIGRALPDVRDGLKPVHRRILFAMNERRWTHENAYVKCAKIVGEVIGNFHPHGDMAVYDTMVRMAQDFAIREPLIDGQGNFGSVDGDNAAAYRYTEARLSRIAGELLKDIKKETVDYVPNFDNTRKEPMVLPASFPNLLVNGASGIAVGMATNIPTHNLGEVIDAVTYFIDNPDCKINELLKFIPGPDFPTGGILYGYEGIKNAYLTGKGKVMIRAKTDIEEKAGKDTIVITEIPYQVNKSDLIASIANLVRDKKVDGITSLRDESDRKGLRITIEIRRDAQTQIILNQLFKHTQMQITFGIIMLALVDNTQPRVLNLKQIIEEYVKHRKEVVVRRTKFDLQKAEEQAHILEGLVKALDMIDAVIKTIRASKTVEMARTNLMQKFKFTEIQANAILEMKLQKLTSLEKQKLVEELEGLKKMIKELKAILASSKKIYDLIKKELTEVKNTYPEKRKTEIIREITDFTVEDIIADEDMAITLSNDGFIKCLPAKQYKKQRRGGKGVTGAALKGDDSYVRNLSVASTHDNMLFFTNKGKVFYMKVYEIPAASKQAKGRSLKILLNLAPDEKISTLINIKEFSDDYSIILITKKGIIKKVASPAFENAKKRGIIGINLQKDDELVDAQAFSEKEDKDIFIGTANGRALRTSGKKLRLMGRNSRGIRGIRIKGDDKVVGMAKVDQNKKLFVITERGFGKCMKFNLFPSKGRGGKGMAYLKITDKNGRGVSVGAIDDENEIIILSSKGMVIRVDAKEISTIGRNTAGVRIFKLDEGDVISDVAAV